MKKFLKTIFIFAALLAAGCSEKGLDLSVEDESGNETVSHEMIVLGKKLDDPYSVSNVTKALASLYPTKAGRVDVTPTDIYVRFLPKTEEEYQKLVTLGYELMDHPLDYQIVKDGDYYHDQDVSEEEITWQYAVVPHRRHSLQTFTTRCWTTVSFRIRVPARSLMTALTGMRS